MAMALEAADAGGGLAGETGSRVVFLAVFLAYNDEGAAIESLRNALQQQRITVLQYDPEALPEPGGEDRQLRSVAAVVVALGSRGWGAQQRDIVIRAINAKTPLVCVRIGDPPAEALNDVDGLFRQPGWIDLRRPSPAGYEQVARAVAGGEAGSSGFYDIINTLVDGSDEQRSQLLHRVGRDGVPDREGLAARLRSAIQEEFSPDQENNFATAIRDPKRLASARSWMLSLLIAVDPESPESRSLLLKQVGPSGEPDRTVRFWALAGLLQGNVSYLRDALSIATSDPAPDVAGLARLALAPDDRKLHEEFRAALRSDRFETAWHVLRIFRILPILALAPDVVDQLDRSAEGKALAYDALFALADPQMAHQASAYIEKRFGTAQFVELVLREARSSTPVARRAFARVLSVFDREAVEAALQSAVEREPELENAVAFLRSEMAAPTVTITSVVRWIAGYASDTIDVDKDALNIGGDVERLVSVMIARDVTPPLAIGLFGPWGSGKSFYMKSMLKRAARLAEDARREKNTQFHYDVVQIEFNAWHYVDTNLWASLVSHILDGLAKRFQEDSFAATKADLVGQLASAKAEKAAAEQQRDSATLALAEASKALDRTVEERERRELALRDFRASDLINLLRSDETIEKNLREALQQVGAPAAVASIEELNKVVKDSYSTAGRAAALIASLFKGRNVAIALFGVAALIVAPPLVGEFVKTYFPANSESLSKAVTGFAVAAASVAALLRSALGFVNKGLDALAAAKRKVDEQLDRKRAEPSAAEKDLLRQVGEAKAAETTAAQRLAAASAAAQALEEKLAAIERGRSLDSFVAERNRSDDYRRHLGLMAVIRRDFEDLIKRLQEGQINPAKRVDRIILYIDDLDRLPAEKVIDVLQAVHLLLTFPLFVVVVCVDPRWLLHALKTNFGALAHGELAGANASAATPQDYLEKIFQIPFSVRPMDDKGFSNLMRGVFSAANASSASPAGGRQEQPPVDDRADPRPEPAKPSPEAPAPTDRQRDGPATPPEAKPAPPPPTLETLAQAIAICAPEAAFAETLYGLLPTPRSAKRFANVYRLLKATAAPADLARFEGTVESPGEFQTPMLLLAALVGAAAEAAVLFPQFAAAARAGQRDWWRTPAETAPETRAVGQLRRDMTEIILRTGFPRDVALAREWLPQVARYSFSTARLFLDER